jgi:acetylornithine deacetylase/succinyl-diaminopimelate desuccinylase-like protein
VNSIPESASIKVDIRSAAPEQIDRLERALREAVDRAVSEEPRTSFGGRAQP